MLNHRREASRITYRVVQDVLLGRIRHSEADSGLPDLLSHFGWDGGPRGGMAHHLALMS